MKDVSSQVGFSQRVRLEWLDFTAGLVLNGRSRSEIDTALQNYLKERLSVGGSAVRGNREKAITILLKVWAKPPAELAEFHQAGLELLRRLPVKDHLPLHWCMTMAVYPFWGAVAETVGRLLRLQKDVAAPQVQRRLKEVLGERDTVARAARRILRSFIDWGVLKESRTKGVYTAASPGLVADDALASWVIEAVMRASNATWLPVETLLAAPALFPLGLPADTRVAINQNPRIEVARHGVGEVIARIRQDRQMAGTLTAPLGA